MVIKKGYIYMFDKIEQYANDNGFEINEFGENDLVGEYFIVLRKNSGYINIISFIMVSLVTYECIYTDV
jgi:hypothetical protein